MYKTTRIRLNYRKGWDNADGWRRVVDDFYGAFICLANYARFTGGQRQVMSCVQSRMCLWCKDGFGKVIINRKSYSCEPGNYFFLPWNHRIEYIPDKSHPFYLAGIHIVPDHRFDHAAEYEVPHNMSHRLYGCSWRRDVRSLLPGGVKVYHVSRDSHLYMLSESIVRLFRMGPPRDENQFRALGRALIPALINTSASKSADPFIPPVMRGIFSYIENNITNPISVTDIAREMKRSKSSVTWLFKTYCDTSPIQWINRKKISRACDLLSTTNMPVGTIGASVGIDDQFYFSKLFKKIAGRSPLAYRRKNQYF